MASKTLNSYDFGEKLYQSLPQLYRDYDPQTNHTTRRYLQALADGGFAPVIEELNGILNLSDTEKTPSAILPILFKQYGLDMFYGVPEPYLRKMLPIISELFSKKGSITDVEYLTNIISGVKSSIEVSPSFNTDRSISVRLEMDYSTESNKGLPDRDQLLRIIEEFVPFYCTVSLIYVYMFYEDGKLGLDDPYDYSIITQKNEETARPRVTEHVIKNVVRFAKPPKEDCYVETPSDTLLNKGYNTLNTSFTLNSWDAYDVIRVHGRETVIPV